MCQGNGMFVFTAEIFKVKKPKEEIELSTTESSESIDPTQSDFNKNDHEECYSSDDLDKDPKQTGSAGPRNVLTKQTDNSKPMRPGTTKARPIPEDDSSDYIVPRDPDKDSPDVYVSISVLFLFLQLN